MFIHDQSEISWRNRGGFYLISLACKSQQKEFKINYELVLPHERRGRKATGLPPEQGHDSGVAGADHCHGLVGETNVRLQSSERCRSGISVPGLGLVSVFLLDAFCMK